MREHSVPFYSIEQTLEKVARSLYPFSSLSESGLLYKKKIPGSLFNVNEEIEVVENIKTKDIKYILEELLRLSEGGYLVDIPEHPDACLHIDLSCGTLTVPITSSRLICEPSLSYSFIERKLINHLMQTNDTQKMHYLKDIFKCAHVKNILLEAFINKSIRMYQMDDWNDGDDPSRPSFNWSLCFSEEQTIDQKMDNWSRVLLSNRYVSYKDRFFCNFYFGEDYQDVACKESRIGIHPIDLQTFINNLLTKDTSSWDIGIDDAFSFLSSLKEKIDTYDIIVPFLKNIEQTPKLEKMPIKNALTQLYQHYSGSLLELTPLEELYAQIRIEFSPNRIAELTKPQLVSEITKYLEYKGFKILAQQKGTNSKEVKGVDISSLDDKRLFKIDVESIATLLFDQRKKIGGARRQRSSVDSSSQD